MKTFSNFQFTLTFVFFLVSFQSFAESQKTRTGFLGGYVVERTDLSYDKNFGVSVGDIILTHQGELVISDFDRALVKEAMAKSFIDKFSSLTADNDKRKAKVSIKK